MDELKFKKINVVINVTDEIDNFHENYFKITYYKFPIKDNNHDDISDILEKTFDIIDYHINKGDNVLVHCFMGASRSASVIIFYLMKKLSINYNQAKYFVTEKRRLVNLTPKFEEILKNKENNSFELY